MKIKKEYIVLVVLIVALSLYLLLRKEDRTHYEVPTLQEIPVADIKKVEIAKSEGAVIILDRKEGGWVISTGGYLADKGKVSAMLDTIGNLTLSALVSESKSYERYGLSGADKIGVKAWTDQGLKRDFDVGREASSFQHTFVKIAGDDRVFHARENFRNRFDQTVDGLRDKTVLRFEPSEIEEIEVADAEKSVTFTRKPRPVEASADQGSKSLSPGEEAIWESLEGKADAAKLTQILTTLSGLKCEAYLHERQKGDFENPVYSVKLKGPEVYSLSLFAKGDKNEKEYPAVSSQNDSAFLLPERQAVRIMIPPGDLLAKP